MQSQSADKHLLCSNEQKATPSGAARNILGLLNVPLNAIAKCIVKLTFISHDYLHHFLKTALRIN